MSEVTERAVLAGGCFWGMQDLIRKRPGVISTRVGYTGGDVANATYRNHGSHAEAIEIIFDPEQESFRGLLEFFQIVIRQRLLERNLDRHRRLVLIRDNAHRHGSKVVHQPGYFG